MKKMTIKEILSSPDFGFERTKDLDDIDVNIVLKAFRGVMNEYDVNMLRYSINKGPHFIENMNFIYDILAWFVKHGKIRVEKASMI